MSKSYHSTINDLKGKSKREINEMIDDPDPVLHDLAMKKKVKKAVKKQRKVSAGKKDKAELKI